MKTATAAPVHSRLLAQIALHGLLLHDDPFEMLFGNQSSISAMIALDFYAPLLLHENE